MGNNPHKWATPLLALTPFEIKCLKTSLKKEARQNCAAAPPQCWCAKIPNFKPQNVVGR